MDIKQGSSNVGTSAGYSCKAQQQQQQQQRKLGSPADGVGGRQGRAESDEEDDMMMAETPTQREWTRLICSA